MIFKLSNPYPILAYIIKSLFAIGVIGNILFGTVWCVYFLFRIKVLRKKVCILKKQTDERCFDVLKNAKVDYIKSIFIAAISFSEVMFHLGFIAAYISQKTEKNLKNCTSELFFLNLTHQSQAYRANCVLIVTFGTIFISLIHILTSYLSHAYSEKRITNIMRRERVMFAWLFIQLVCVWCSIFYWPLFVLTLPIMAVVALIGHLCLYWKYGRELYSVIRRRERDALFEDVHSHRKLFKMLQDYKKDAILYFVYIFLFTVSIISSFSAYLIRVLLEGDCLVEKYFRLDLQILKQMWTDNISRINIIIDLFVMTIITVSLLLIHISIMYKLMVRMFKKRSAMNKPTRFSRSTLFQPLIGNK